MLYRYCCCINCRLIITSRLIGGQLSTLSSKEMIQLYLTMAAIGIAVVIFVRQQYTKIKHQRELRQYERIAILNGERRYTMMVIETNQDTICTGFVYGEMKVMMRFVFTVVIREISTQRL